MGTKEAKAAEGEAVDVIFKTYSRCWHQTRDAWVYNFNRNGLMQNMRLTIDTYNVEVDRWKRRGDQSESLDDFVLSDDKKIKWSSALKQKLKSGQIAEFADTKIRQSLYRPFTKSNLFFDRVMNHRVGMFALLSSPHRRPKRKIV